MGRAERIGPILLAGLAAAVLACASATPRSPTREADAGSSKPDLFPGISADLERQLAARRDAALARGAEEKAKQIDPFSVDGWAGRLEELGVESFGSCVRGRRGLGETGALIEYRLLSAGHYQAREPILREDEANRAIGLRTPIRPVVYVACAIELEARPVATGGFVAESRSLHFAALFDPQLSWWNPSQGGDETTRGFGQLQFDVAHLLAREANRGKPVVRGTGPTERAALDDLELQLADRLGRVDRELRRVQAGLEQATSHGWDAEAVERWTERARYGLGELRRALPSAGRP